MVCASKSVSRVLYLTVIYLRAVLPRRFSHPGSGRASLGTRSPCSHTGVAPDRVYSIGHSRADGCALTAPFHLFPQHFAFPGLHVLPPSRRREDVSGETACALAANPERQSAQVVYFCCTFPQITLGGRYPLSLPCGARTFLTASLSASPRDCLLYSHNYFSPSGGACQRKIHCYFFRPALYYIMILYVQMKG